MTALQSLIKMLTIELNAVEHDKYPDRTKTLKMAIKFAQMQLPIERKQIEDAFEAGEHSARSYDDDTYDTTTATDYYNKNYGND
jgi:hypothetical protein